MPDGKSVGSHKEDQGQEMASESDRFGRLLQSGIANISKLRCVMVTHSHQNNINTKKYLKRTFKKQSVTLGVCTVVLPCNFYIFHIILPSFVCFCVEL